MNMEEKLRRLILENPGLQLVPMCSEECGSPDWGYIMCDFTDCMVDKWTINPYHQEHILYWSDGFEDFEDAMMEDETEATEEDVKAAWTKLDWHDAIIVYINAV